MIRLTKRSNSVRIRQKLLMFCLFTASINVVYASCGLKADCHKCCRADRGSNGCPWRPFITLGGGIALTSNIGRTVNLPDPIPGPNGVDAYTVNHGVQTVGAVDAFVGMEYRFHPLARLQLGLGYNQTSSYEVEGTAVQGRGSPTPSSFLYQYKIVARQYLFETKLLANLWWYYHPYIVLGAGVSQNSAFGYQTISPSVLLQPQFANQTTGSFTYNAGFGIDIEMVADVRFGLGYRFIDFGKVQLGNAVSNSSSSGTLSQPNFYANELLAQVTFVI